MLYLKMRQLNKVIHYRDIVVGNRFLCYRLNGRHMRKSSDKKWLSRT